MNRTRSELVFKDRANLFEIFFSEKAYLFSFIVCECRSHTVLLARLNSNLTPTWTYCETIASQILMAIALLDRSVDIKRTTALGALLTRQEFN